MTDRDEVIKGIQECNLNGGRIGNCPYKGILLLLEEREGTINELQNAYGYLQKQYFEAQDKLLKEQPEIVRCKDCMYNSISDGESLGQCLIQYGWFPARPDWYCADGRKKDAD